MIALVSTSLNSTSRSRVLLRAISEMMNQKGEAHIFVDLRDYDLPLCDGGACYEHPAVHRLAEVLKAASSVIFGLPVYNYSIGSSAKNLLELVGHSFDERVVGVVAAAGGPRGFMAPLQFMNSVMIDFRCLVVPKYVYANESDFESEGIVTAGMYARLSEMHNTVLRLSAAMTEISSANVVEVAA